MPELASVQGLADVPGFRAMGVHAGLKKGRPDLAIILSDVPDTQCAAVFTQNAFAAAPVHIGRQHVADGCIQAIVVNSGNANACTGRQGLRDTLTMARTAATALGLQPEQVLVCSTGRIGIRMPMDKVEAGIKDCAARLDEGTGAEVSQAILTTDTGPKEARTTFEANGKTCTLAGIAKGAGMIHPNMATMLAFMVTDAPVSGKHLRRALRDATDVSFNQISVDGDESTNDTAAIMANGAAGGPPLDPDHPDWPAFRKALDHVCMRLARRIAADGEGATRLIEVQVTGARNDSEARIAARAVARSNLVKSAIHGSDPNWGRIVAAIGSTDVSVEAERVTIKVGNGQGLVTVLDEGEPLDVEQQAHALLQSSQIVLAVDLAVGTAHGMAWGCDLTPEYVTFNAEYTT